MKNRWSLHSRSYNCWENTCGVKDIGLSNPGKESRLHTENRTLNKVSFREEKQRSEPAWLDLSL